MGTATGGVETVANTLNSGINASSMWAAVDPFMGFIVTLTLFGFGFYILRKALKKARTGKNI